MFFDYESFIVLAKSTRANTSITQCILLLILTTAFLMLCIFEEKLNELLKGIPSEKNLERSFNRSYDYNSSNGSTTIYCLVQIDL